MEPDNLDTTINTYDQIAEVYYERHLDRPPIKIHINQFVEWLRRAGHTSGSVLDLGCGPGFDSAAIQAHGLRAIGLDLSNGMLQQARKRFEVSLLRADMRYLPFKKRFAGIWSCASILHTPRDQVPGILDGCRRVLLQNGVLYLSLKQGTGDEWQTSILDHSLKRYTVYWQPEKIDRLLNSSGFTLLDGWSEKEEDGTDWLVRYAIKK